MTNVTQLIRKGDLTMDVFNGSNVSARNLLAMTPSDDKFVEENIPCTARIHVESAHFKSMYRGTLLPVP